MEQVNALEGNTLILEDILEIHRILLGKLQQLIDEFVSSLHSASEHEAKIAADAHLQFVFIHPLESVS